MLIPHPTILRRLVEEYETLMAHEDDGTDDTRRRELRAQDLAYTLCVSTGTREVGRALETAHRLLAAAYDPAVPGQPRAGSAGVDDPPAQEPAIAG